ncbi:error-prone DNA polymerase [Marinobacter halodurans]|uniref:Error-prone DNA polymerase n=1 Tax=Marinobacter halodurans TaxID=2528979 RepID=A0ABY1ZIZ8_9GAMM|nr:error-prone DNA polymerase [Marinobacter halodurans]TBW54596.1 error-prone DNA polymerase [Marinobacter halodurans]
MSYAELHCLSNFSFLRGASHPRELAEEACRQGYHALAITDECSVAGMPRAYAALKSNPVKLITGSEFLIQTPELQLVLLARTRKGYGQLCQLITTGRRRAEKGTYSLFGDDLETHALDECLALWQADPASEAAQAERGQWLKALFPERLWIMAERTLDGRDDDNMTHWRHLGQQLELPIVATGHVHMHQRSRQPLQDVLTAIRHGCTVAEAGHHLFANGERYLRPIDTLRKLFPSDWIEQSLVIADRCTFCPSELRYRYPPEVVPRGHTPGSYLRELVEDGIRWRFPDGIPVDKRALVEKELTLIREKEYEPYFLTIHDIVQFARRESILCQGRGSSANSIVCYCLGITEVDPGKVELLFERFISADRDEPPDIDVDFEHERREEVIQYIYRRYGRERAALAATVIRYRHRSAIRDVGKALGFDLNLLEQLIDKVDWRDKQQDWREQMLEKGITRSERAVGQFISLVNTLYGFPRHLSQHVGGFVISEGPLAELVPVENASMADRTVIQWDKEDLESLNLMKVDVLALGMLSAIRKAFEWIGLKEGRPFRMPDVIREDSRVYDMLCTGDSIGVFQVESRAQINMLPRLKPRKYYDLVIEVAIVRPGPIQGDMVHPYLKRRDGKEKPDYGGDPEIKAVLERTEGVPIFQEQAIKLAMVAADFTGSEADKLRRAMAAWKSDGDLTPFRDKLIDGMLAKGHTRAFAERIYTQLSGFGGYGFPESHAASFALLVYVSAWIKCHHAPAFYCALLNSQPMGFYSPSQLVQDARRHHVVIHPIDVNHSLWDHTLENRYEELRLGLRLVKGLSEAGAERLVAARPTGGYTTIEQLRQRAALDNRDLECLASAGALRAFSDNRHQARWDILDYDAPAPIFAQEEPSHYTVHGPQPEDIRMPIPSEGEDVLEDYASQGLTLQRHPLALLREQGQLRHCQTAEGLKSYPNGRLVHVAGLVTGRQRPGSGKGVTFVTLEDETGNTNVVVWLNTARRQRQPLIKSRLLHVKGILEREGDIVHVMAGKLTDLSHLLGSLKVHSRDFR